MPLVCKTLHHRFEGVHKRAHFGEVDEQGRLERSCKECEYSIFTDSLYCKCCGGKMRTRPRKWINRRNKDTREYI